MYQVKFKKIDYLVKIWLSNGRKATQLAKLTRML